MLRTGRHSVGVQAVKQDDHAPADDRRIDPGRSGRRRIDEEEHEIDDHVSREMAVEAAQGPRPPPRPLLDFGKMRRIPRADARSQFDWLATLATHRCCLLPHAATIIRSAASLYRQSPPGHKASGAAWLSGAPGFPACR